jgi:iron complex outermembrane receptor protein
MRNKSVRTYALAALVACGGASRAAAQEAPTGTIQGRVVVDSTGGAVHGATVSIVGAPRTVTTSEDGQFEFTKVAPGTYDLVAQREHFSAARQTVTVAAGQIATVEFRLALESKHETVTVTGQATGTSTTFESFNSVISLDSFDLIKRLGAGLTDVLQDEPGIAKRTFGPGSSRPIIRGFDGDRVLIMQDGVRTGDLSSQSGDHGVSIEAAGLSRVEVVKGPATLLYGSNAIGGVVNAISQQEIFRATPFRGTMGGVTFDAGSANGQAGAAMNVQHGTGPALFYGSFTTRRTGDYDSPIGTIANSATRLRTGEAGGAWTGARAFFSVGGGIERNRYGVPFAGLFEGEPDAQIDLDVRRRTLRADAGMRNLGGAFADGFRVTASFLDYRHDEIETEGGEEALGTRFNNRVVTLRAELEQPHGRRLGGRVGAELFTRQYSAVGEEALAPATDHRSFALFAYEEARVGNQRIQFGARYEHNRYESAVDRTFNGLSGSLGIHSEIGEATAVVANLTAASRAPALEELFNFGPHLGNLAFEVGNPDLELERTLGLDVSVRRRHGRISGELNGFLYAIRNFVFLDVTDEIEDGLRVSHYQQGDSRFTGMEAQVHVEAHERAEINASVAFVRATLTETGEALPRIPPVHARLGVTAHFGDLTVTPEVVAYGRQGRVFRDETPTAGWVTFGISAAWQKVAAHATHVITASAYNLSDATYRLHTSFIKDLAPEIGRGVRLVYTVRLF